MRCENGIPRSAILAAGLAEDISRCAVEKLCIAPRSGNFLRDAHDGELSKSPQTRGRRQARGLGCTRGACERIPPQVVVNRSQGSSRTIECGDPCAIPRQEPLPAIEYIQQEDTLRAECIQVIR